MKRSIMSWHLAIFAALTTVLLLVQSASSDDEDQKGKGKKGKSKAPDVVEVDLGKLPPDLARELRAQLQTKKGKGRAISLTDAIKIVEAKGTGEVERASRKTSKSGETTFSIEVNTGERHRTRYTLDARGKITETRKAD
jgi:uncharacterized membrane protein YkoI